MKFKENMKFLLELTKESSLVLKYNVFEKYEVFTLYSIKMKKIRKSYCIKKNVYQNTH